MKTSLYSFLITLLVATTANAQLSANSRRFVIKDYFYLTPDGDFKRYYAHGYAQQRTSQTRGRVFLLPILSWDREELKFINSDGEEFDPEYDSDLAQTIIIPLNFQLKMPDKTQIPAISSVLERGVEPLCYYPPIARGVNNTFYIYPPARQLEPMLVASAADYQRVCDEQKALVDLYDNYATELISLSQLEVSVVMDNSVISNQLYGNTVITSSGQLTSIEIVSPSRYQQNRLRNGNFRLVVDYKFRDAQTSYIDARFDAKRIVDHFLEETQKSMRSSSSSGWQVLGFGNRRKTIRTSLNSTVRENYQGENYQNTVVEMFDATEDMIAEFEREFFPELSRQKVIDNHLAAAEEARNNGNNELYDLHIKYAAALQSSDPNLEVDIAAAVASLSAGDYAGFIANGVRFGSHSSSGNSSFRRVVHTRSEIEQHTGWSQIRTVSVQHALSENVVEAKTESHRPRIGICSASQYNYPVYSQDIWGRMQTTAQPGIMPTCIVEGSPAHQAGLAPGMIVSKIGGRVITSPTELSELMSNYEPGDMLRFTIIEYNGFQMYERNINVRLRAGGPMDEND